MAGLHIEMTVTEDGASQALSRLFESGLRPRPALAQIGERLIRSHEQRFIDQVDPEGNPWAPLDSKYLRSKRKQKSRGASLILVLDGYLQSKFTYDAGEAELLFGTNLEYGATQHFGSAGRDIPARPFLGISDGDERAITAIIQDYLEGSFTGR